MGTPAQGEPYAEAAGEAVQTALMSVRLILAVADAVRRQQQRQKQKAEEALSPVEQAVKGARADLKDLLPADITRGILEAGDWPQMAQQLMALKQAGVDLEQLLPRVGEVAVVVRDQVAAKAAAGARERAGEWVRVLREALPAGPVREAVLASPAWPDIAAMMVKLDERGIDVRRILASAYDEGLGVEKAVAKGAAAGQTPTTSRDALVSYGPMTDGLDIPPGLDLDDRAHALRQLAISPQDNGRYARLLKEALPGREREVDLALTARQWPLVAARMAQMEDLAGKEGQRAPLAEHLAGLAKDPSWGQDPRNVGSQLVQAANHVLRHPPGEAPPVTRPRVSTTAARSQSTTVGPTKAAAKGAVPAEPAVAAHRRSGPAPRSGKTK
ncbi:hypothetical protein [Streptomyces sp. NPDC047097]|uniref:hypothetical protein n=1 Tax=Streptomyces sp. NPDC047097 TaxID=3155260 RepID=UPI00340EA7D4